MGFGWSIPIARLVRKGARKATNNIVGLFTEDKEIINKFSTVVAVGSGLLINKVLLDGAGVGETLVSELIDSSEEIESITECGEEIQFGNEWKDRADNASAWAIHQVSVGDDFGASQSISNEAYYRQFQ